MARPRPRAPVPSSPSRLKTVDVKKVIDDLLAEKYVSPRAQMAFLPYYDEISQSIDDRLEHLESGLIVSCLLLQQKSIHQYLGALNGFIYKYGLRFTKERQLKLLKLAYLIMTKEGQNKKIVSSSASLLKNLIDASLTYRDIELDWNVIYDVYVAMPSEVKGVVKQLKRFYAPEEIKKIWEKLQIHNTPGNKKKFFDFCLSFLPDHLNGEEQKKYGAVHWWNPLWQSYVNLGPKSKATESLPKLFSEVVKNAPNFMDLSPLHGEFMKRLLGSVGLTLRRAANKAKDTLAVSQKNEYDRWSTLWNFAPIVGDLLGGPRSIQDELQRVMNSVERFLQSSPKRETKSKILDVMVKLAERVKQRYQEERIAQKSRKPKNFQLGDDDIQKFVSCMLPSAMEMMFSDKLKSKNHCNCDGCSTMRMCDSCEIVRILAFLSPHVVLPKFFDKVNEVLDIGLRPRQIKHILTCIIGIAEDFKTVDGLGEHQKVWDKSVSGVRNKVTKLLEDLCAPEDGKYYFKTLINTKNAATAYRMLCFELKENSDLLSDEFVKLACRTLEKTLNTIPRVLIKENQTEMRWKRGVFESESDEDQNKDTSDEDDSDEDTVTDKYDSDDGEAKTTRLKLSVSTLLEHSSEEVKERFVDLIYTFIASNDFEKVESNSSATWLYKGILKQVVLTCPDSFPRFATFFLEKLKLHVAPKIRRKTELTPTGKWYLDLAEGLFSTTSEALIQHKELCFEIISLLLLDYECARPYWMGGTAVFSSLFTLTRTYALATEFDDDKRIRHLNTWSDRQEWPHKFLEIHGTQQMSWHVPDESCRTLAEELLCRFVFPAFEMIRNPNLEVPQLKTLLDILVYTLKAAHPCFAHSHAPPDPSENVPSPKRSPIRIPKPNLKIIHPSGRHVHEMVLELCEHLVDRLEAKEWGETKEWGEADDVKYIAQHIVWLLKGVFTNRQIDFGLEFRNHSKRAEEIFKMNALYPNACGAEKGDGSRYDYYSGLHFATVARETPERCNRIQMRAIDILLRVLFVFHDKWDVRSKAEEPLCLVPTMEVTEYRVDVLERVVALLNNGVTKNQVQALSTVIGIIHRWAEWEDDKMRIEMWKALAGVEALDLPGAARATDKFVKDVNMYRIPPAWDQLDVGECENYCYDLWKDSKKRGVWTEFVTDQQLDEAKKSYKDDVKKDNKELKSMLLELEKTKRRRALVSAMLKKMDNTANSGSSDDDSSDGYDS